MKTVPGIAMVVLLAAVGAFAQSTPDKSAAADKSFTPIVFVHGANGAGDQFERQAMHFTSNGYPSGWTVTFDYDTSTAMRGERPTGPAADRNSPEFRAQLAERMKPIVEPLDKLVDDVRKRTGFEKINLIGHSLGTAVSAAYLSDAARAGKIAHYVSIGGGQATNPNGVPSLAVSGLGDNGRGPSASDGGVVAWMPDYQDHVMVCTSDESFWAVYTFLNDGKKPKHLRITPEERPEVGGYVKSYINNKPLAGAKVEVWEVAKETGMRTKDKPFASFTVADNGAWGPFVATPDQPYEIVVHDESLAKARRYFRTPFNHSNRLVYLRISGTGEGFSPSPFDRSPEYLTEKNAVYIVRHQNGGLLPGVMTLKLNGQDLITESILPTTDGPRQNPTVGLYLADGKADGKSEFAGITDAAFRGAFVTSADVFVPADPKGHVEFRLNDRVLNVPATSGAEAGPISVVFEDFN